MHCRQEITDADYLVYFESLKDRDPDAVRVAIVRCRESLSYLPKLNEILDHLAPIAKSPDLKRTLKREWVEPYNARKQIHYYEYEDGGRSVKFEDVA